MALAAYILTMSMSLTFISEMTSLTIIISQSEGKDVVFQEALVYRTSE